MGIADRQAQIVEMLQQKDFPNVEELAEYFQVPTQTIRAGKINDPTKAFPPAYATLVTNL